ncbi:hypothetical protein GCM10025882_26570 [Acinetobacter gyllenbergii]|uniref:Uncharacterized protein n=1 Tax=Acinetobacter gyllenbergii CIP 110306 = MTCC 11365 TaxID=1217657 RepID=A0A829HHW4_9GAMM|nr:hypothetical protein F957_01938 [Acinetobacter gyllenbergii CIP 110306 = MTCC 11365]ESK56986.1 hypothetical protein F987_00268 [Acinetobacter gyllenbergii NIPH 230]OBY75317.1 hypothetical protein NG55_01190 [Acinetobacter gyllenbergii]GMA12232.1 hypothetical protein GCM10025882_26570 [Acinetobacter gyllenbergii]
MKIFKSLSYLLFIGILGLSIFSNAFSNVWRLATDQTNDIPEESNIFSFHPTKINEGSSSYWLYGEDSKYYYYFSETEENTYYIFDKSILCPNIEKIDFRTWCETIRIVNEK